jgi:predicted O-linked N-acetylglucosamine transferase (SPINDLY family)
MDYLIADHVLITPDQRHHYSEKIIYLPTYQANDCSRVTSVASLGKSPQLNTNKFKFACLNNTFKYNPSIFSAWVAILKAAPDSELFLLVDDPGAFGNLRSRLELEGVDGDRLHLWPRTPIEQYRANLKHVDLYLDTHPYGAGATGSEVLWSEVPLVSLRGRSFCSRMASSLLTAVGLEELVVDSVEDYVGVAVKVATDKAYRESVKEKLRQGKVTGTLYNSTNFARNLEEAFRTAVTIESQGKQPVDFAVNVKLPSN